MSDFVIIKVLDVNIRLPRSPNIREVLWSLHNINKINCNCNGSFNPGTKVVGCGGIFRNHKGDFILAFAENMLFESSVFDELFVVLKFIYIAKHRGWSKIWIETDCIMVVEAFSKLGLVPLRLKDRWQRSLDPSNQTNIITHLHKEGNFGAVFF